MTSKDDKNVEEKINDFFQNYSFEIIKCVFNALDLLLSRCNSFEDFKNGVKQTIDNLMEEME